MAVAVDSDPEVAPNLGNGTPLPGTPLPGTPAAPQPLALPGDAMEVDPPSTSLVQGGLQIAALTEQVAAFQVALQAQTTALETLTTQAATPHYRPLAPPSNLPILVSSDTLRSLRSLLDDPTARFSFAEQGQATELIGRRSGHVVVVLPTGAGKSATVLANVKKEQAQRLVTVWLVPTKALVIDQKNEATKKNILAREWTNQDSVGTCNLIFAVFERLLNEYFLAWLKLLASQGLLGRMIVDEGHHPITNVSYRPGLAQIGIIQRLRVPVVLLTATLPPILTRRVLEFCGIPSAREIRAPTPRLNLEYNVRKVNFNCRVGEPAYIAGFHAILSEIFSDLRLPSAHVPATNTTPEIPANAGTLGMVFVSSKKLIGLMIDFHNAFIAEIVARNAAKPEGSVLEPVPAPWVAFHADLTPLQRAEALTRWGTICLIIFTTSLLGCGLHRPNIPTVCHMETPNSMIDFAQESGRAGRDGSRAKSYIIYTGHSPIPLDDLGGKQELIDNMATAGCRRPQLDTYMDGFGYTCYSYPAGTAECDNCRRDMETEAPLTITAPVPPPPPPPVTALQAQHANAPQDERELLAILTALRKKCSGHYVCGQGQDNQNYLYCTSLGPESSSERSRQFQEFKKGVLYSNASQQNGGRGICFMCWAPRSKLYHSGADNQRMCIYPDIIPQALYCIWVNDRAHQWFDAWMTSENIGNLKAFQTYLATNTIGWTYPIQVLLWFDKELGLAADRGEQTWSVGRNT